jgi:hypothetical protein
MKHSSTAQTLDISPSPTMPSTPLDLHGGNRQQLLTSCSPCPGFLLQGVLDAHARKAISNLSYLVFIPSLLLYQLGSTLDGSRLLHWWPLCVNIVLTCAGLPSSTPPQLIYTSPIRSRLPQVDLHCTKLM